jgi:hypothetical protein
MRHRFLATPTYRPDLRNTNVQGYDMRGLDLRGMQFGGAQMQGAFLGGAQMQGAILGGAQMSEDTDLTAATLRGAAVRSVDHTTITCLRDHWEVIFADATVQVPCGERPARWPNEELDYDPLDPDTSPFHVAWREWQATLPPEEGE